VDRSLPQIQIGQVVSQQAGQQFGAQVRHANPSKWMEISFDIMAQYAIFSHFSQPRF
jgi:hypothetical protein